MRRPSAHYIWMCALAVVTAVAPTRTQEVTATARVTLDSLGKPAKYVDNSNVVVWLTPLPGTHVQPEEPQPGPAPTLFRMVQKNKQFDPRILVVPVGASVEFPNLDPFFHNVFSLFEGKRFDLGLYEAGTTRTVRFDRPGICYIFCNIHPEMGAAVIVLKTPYYGVSDRAGEIKIPHVIPGRYQLEVWYGGASPDALRRLSHPITIAEDSGLIGNIRLSASKDLLRTHKNKYGRDYDSSTPSDPLYVQP